MIVTQGRKISLVQVPYYCTDRLYLGDGRWHEQPHYEAAGVADDGEEYLACWLASDGSDGAAPDCVFAL
jgi:hypothetical protein